jgi:hypothetical protein
MLRSCECVMCHTDANLHYSMLLLCHFAAVLPHYLQYARSCMLLA